VSLFLWLIHLGDSIAKLAAGTFLVLSTISNTFTILIRILVMFIIFSFMREIQNEGSSPSPAHSQML
jgi:hypothetical protein